MAEEAIKDWGKMDKKESFMVGDYISDEKFADNLGIKYIDVNDFLSGKYENIKKDFKFVCQNINLPIMDISTFKYKTNARPKKTRYRSMYTEEGKNIIAKFFKKDIKLFNYKF